MRPSTLIKIIIVLIKLALLICPAKASDQQQNPSISENSVVFQDNTSGTWKNCKSYLKISYREQNENFNRDQFNSKKKGASK